MNDKEKVKKLEELDENQKHRCPPCDEPVQITLNRTDAETLKEILNYILKQLK